MQAHGYCSSHPEFFRFLDGEVVVVGLSVSQQHRHLAGGKAGAILGVKHLRTGQVQGRWRVGASVVCRKARYGGD